MSNFRKVCSLQSQVKAGGLSHRRHGIRSRNWYRSILTKWWVAVFSFILLMTYSNSSRGKNAHLSSPLSLSNKKPQKGFVWTGKVCGLVTSGKKACKRVLDLCLWSKVETEVFTCAGMCVLEDWWHCWYCVTYSMVQRQRAEGTIDPTIFQGHRTPEKLL